MSLYALPSSFYPQKENLSNLSTENISVNISQCLQDDFSDISSSKNEIGKPLSWERNSANYHLVTIKSARIDPSRLLHSGLGHEKEDFREFSSQNKVVLSRDELTSEEMPPRSRSNTNSILHAESQIVDINSSESETLAKSQPDRLLRPFDDHNEAIQFTLSIEFNGQKYTATRTLPSFEQLKNDLQRELSSRLQNKCREESNASWKNQIGKKVCVKDTNLSTPDMYHNTYHFIEKSPLNEIEDDVSIPDLPMGHKSVKKIFKDIEVGAMTMVDFAGRGFNRLHATLGSYCPAMENWLRVVSDLVPSSPSLAQFLWEPSNGRKSMNHFSENQTSSTSSFLSRSRGIPRFFSRKLETSREKICTLESINEEVHIDEDESYNYAGELGDQSSDDELFF